MDVTRAGQILVIMLSPTLAVGAVVYLPRGIRAVRRLVRRASAEGPAPSQQPIEEIAADLRRLLWRHEEFRRSTDAAMRAQHLRVIEGAIGDCALDAARALGLPRPEVPHRGSVPPRGSVPLPELRRLLRALADAGLVLPPAVGLLSSDKRL